MNASSDMPWSAAYSPMAAKADDTITPEKSKTIASYPWRTTASLGEPPGVVRRASARMRSMVFDTRVVAGAALVLATMVGAGCTDEQDPGLAPRDAPVETSDTLGRCPDGGPDATTPPAGCLGPDGQVLRR